MLDAALREQFRARKVGILYDDAYGGLATADALVLESRLQQDLLGSPNQIAAVTAGMRREQPQFADPDLAPAA